MRSAILWLKAGAEAVAACLLAALFLAFLLQVISRYVFNNPLGWTMEACLTLWLWLVFWGSGLVLDDKDHVKFDVVLHWVRPATRRVLGIISASAIVAGLFAALPATLDYITFYKIKRSATLGIRLDYVFSIYGIFAVALIVRYALGAWRIFTGREKPATHGGTTA
jgi:TRAP-type C4-dicarboxylate transport system permease small subunit